MSKSVGSCAGVTFTAPVPNAGSTAASATIGSSPAVERVPDGLADERRVALVVRVHRDPGVAEHRLDARRGHVDVPEPSDERIAERHQLAVDVLVLDLGVRQRRCGRADTS